MKAAQPTVEVTQLCAPSLQNIVEVFHTLCK